jgi:ribosomal protein S8
MTDPISDMLTRIRNAGRALRPTVAVPHSRLKENIAAILKKGRLCRRCGRGGKDTQNHQHQTEVSGQEKRD